MKNFKLAIKDIISLKKYAIFITTLFIVSTLVGIFLEPVYGDKWLALLENILSSISSLSGFGIVIFIIKNNLKIALLGILFGLFFGLFPIFATIVNGLIIGTVLRITARENFFLLWRILPHGIFEIPALVVAFSLGVELGFSMFSKNRLQKLNDCGKKSFRLLIFVIIPLLILAGIIEGLLISIK